MPSAFVLVNTQLEAKRKVLEALRSIEEVEEAHLVRGVYDIIVRVRAETIDRLREIVTWNIKRLSKVKLAMVLSFSGELMERMT